MNNKSGMTKAIQEKVNSKYSLFDITFSYYCHMKCNHCMFDCTPKRSINNIDKEKILQYLDEGIALNKFKSYSFGDQEIFFNLDLFIEIAKYLRQKYKQASLTITTSSYWVKSSEHAAKQFLILKELGLKGVLLSVDDFHQKTVNIQNVIDCTKAALEVGLELSLQTIISKSSRKKEDFKKIFQRNLSSVCNIDKFEWIEHNYTPVGRGATIPTCELLYENKTLVGGCSIMEVIQINPDGAVVPCCGSGSCAKYLTIGNIENKNLGEIIKDAEKDPFMNSLFIWLGPYGLIKILEEHGKTNYLSKKHTGVCHACYEIFSNKDCYDFLAKKLALKTVELFATKWHIEQTYNTNKKGDLKNEHLNEKNHEPNRN